VCNPLVPAEIHNPQLFPAPTERPEGLSPAGLDQHRRARLESAMVEAVARNGYAETTVTELVKLAGVSKTTFYNHFEDKQECFLATFDDIMEALAEAVAEAFAGPADTRQKLTAGLTVFMRLGVDHPTAASLISVDSLTLGPAGIAHRERALDRFSAMLEANLAEVPGSDQVPGVAAQAVIAGLRAIAYWRLRAGNERELPGLVDPLVEWALGYLQPDGELTTRAAAAAAKPAPAPPAPDPSIPGWEDPPDSPRSRRALTQRQRIVRAAARVAADKGYEGLTIPAISATAGISNQTFYEHFESKCDAFLAAFEELASQLMEVTAAALAGDGDRVELLGVAIRTVLEWIAGNELFARLAFFELAVAGPAALDRGDEALKAFTALLTPDPTTSDFTREVPEVVREAIGGGAWGVLLHELHNGRRADLPKLAPEIARFALGPLERG
jgi:AcrR family transcriptional regulator